MAIGLAVTKEAKLERALSIARGLGSAAVAFSGGVDSGLALAICHRALGPRCLAVTADSASFAPEERDEVVRFVAALGVRHAFVETEEVTLQGYRDNPRSRCFVCKTEVYARIAALCAREGIASIVDGTIVDDLRATDRPGVAAGERAGVRSILAEVGLDKDEVRALARALGLPTWDKPAMACLSSRVPYGEEITVEKLEQVARAEAAVRALGFRCVRVRHHGAIGRLEVGPGEIERAAAAETRGALVRAVKGAGFAMAVLDLEGYRAGGFDEA